MELLNGQEIYCGKRRFCLLSAKRREKKTDHRSSKKIIGYALIGILALGAVSVIAFAPRPAPVSPEDESRRQVIIQFQERFCGLSAEASSTAYVTEYELPGKCEMPLAIEVEGDTVWYVSTKNGTLGTYNVADGHFGEQYQAPSWPTRSSATSFSMSWSAKADGNGNIWFTDERQRALWRFDEASQTFSIFPVAAKLPAAIDFDGRGNIYFVGVQSTSIFIGEVSSMKNGTSDGITEVPLPLEGFTGIDANLITTGALTVDRQNNDVWVSLLAFQKKGQLIRYDIDSGAIASVLDLPPGVTSPVGLVVDRAGDLWVSDHGTNIFFRYDRASEEITQFVTSVASPRIYGGIDQQNAYTLPYWIELSPDTRLLWFNQHTGNKISSFDPEELVLTEYWIPSQNRNWALCPENTVSCGLANALQISVDTGGQLWFTEWTENKLGRVDGSRNNPVTISPGQEELTVARGESAQIRIAIDASSNFDGRMISSSNLTPNGRLGNSTGIFSEDSLSLQAGESKEISYVFTASDDVLPGKYTLMLGSGNDEISVLKAVMVDIV